MKQYIELESWKRRDIFNFFKDFYNPIICLTATVECTGAFNRAKERGESFFLHYLYAMLKAHNEIEEFHYRVEQTLPDGEKQITRYDRIDVLTPIKIDKEGNYKEVLLTYHPTWEAFYREATERIAQLSGGGNPFSHVNNHADNLGVCCISALTDLRITCITHTQQHPCGVNQFPLMNVGKMELEGAVRTLPIALSIHHGLADGKHLTDFYKQVESFLK